MRKHFLILMLMALLPLAGWAATWAEVTTRTNISADWTVQLWEPGSAGTVVESASYIGTSVAPDVVLVKGTDYIKSTHFNVTWKNGEGATITAAEVVDVIPGGSYTVTVSGNDDDTYGNIPAANSTASFWVLKNTASFSTDPVLHANQSWDGSALDLLNPAGTLENDFNENAVIEYSIDGGTTWAAGMPKAIKAGEYAVYYRVVGNKNFNGKESTRIGGANAVTKINGTSFLNDDIATPASGKTGLVFTWDDTKGEPVALDLINEGSLISTLTAKGTLKYKVDDTEGWITTVPKRSAAGNYTVKWMIEGNEDYGYLDRDNLEDIHVTIDKATPTINADAAAATGLSYNGAAKALLSHEGTATKGATVKYMIKAPGAGSFATAVAYADVKGQNAGDYKIKPVVVVDDNYYAVTPDDDDDLVITATIAQAPALNAAPTAKPDLTWNKAKQVLIEAGAGTVNGIVEYALTTMEEPTTDQFAAATWVPSVNNDAVKGMDAKTYYAWYRVTNPNYVAVAPTAIPNVKIAPKTVSIIVNNASKKYDGTDAINALTVVAPATTKFTVTNAVEGAAVNVATLKYTGEDAGLGDDYKNADTYVDALTTTVAAVEALNPGYVGNYEYTIVPGNLTINPRPIYVEAKGSTATFGEVYDISKDYIIKGGEAGDVDAAATTTTAEIMAKYFTTAPVLTTDADATLPAVGEYELDFTAGTTAANYTMDLTKGDGENLNGYVIGDKKFEVVEDPTHKLVITVLPHKKTYDGVAESWADVNEGVDYVVSGLIAGDVITKKPTFTRSESDKFDVKYTTDPVPVVTGYDLIASGVTVTNLEAHYPGGIVYNNSTFTIEPAEVTVTVNPQTILKTATTATAANAALNQDAWTVTGLVGPDATTGKSVLGGTLSVNISTSGTAATGQEKAVLGTVGVYGWGIQFAKTNTNYTIKENTQYGELRVIDTKTIELVDTKDMTEALKAANNSTTTSITFNTRTLKEDTWNTLILPFEIKVRDLSAKLGYAVVDMLDESNTDPSKVIFKVATGTIPANTPFMIKTDDEVNLQSILFKTTVTPALTIKIAYTDATTCVAADKAGNKLTGAYKTLKVNDGEYYMNGSGNWKLCGEAFDLKGERVKFTKAAATSAAPTFYIEEGDGTMTVINGETTSIETISAEKLNAAEGWYTLNGVKLQSMPTQKGIYINNGKKVVIK